MSYYFKNLKPDIESDSEDDVDLGETLKKVMHRQKNHKIEEEVSEEGSNDDDDEIQTLSFGSLKKAESLLEKEEKKSKNRTRRGDSKNNNKDMRIEPKTIKSYTEEEFEDDSDSEGAFFEEEEAEEQYDRNGKRNSQDKKTKHKHAPVEQSSKKRVSRIREIPGLLPNNNRNSRLYQDIRFDKSMGNTAEDTAAIRRRYKFLDEYRENEIKEMEKMLRDRKFVAKISDYEKEEMEEKLKSMKSRLQTVKNRDLEEKIVKDYEDEINKGNNSRYHLKKSEKRKVIQKWKFDHMKTKQREKVMERKRKKRLGKEFKQFEFHQRR